MLRCRLLQLALALVLVLVSLTAPLAPVAPASEACAPRPPVAVVVSPGGQVTVSAQTSAAMPANALRALRIGAATNALIDAANYTRQAGSFTVTPPPGPQRPS